MVKVLPLELELGAEQQRAAYEQTRARLGLPEGSDDLRVYVQMTQDQLETLPEASM